MPFKDKTVIVTGAAGGIGGVICARFASEGTQVFTDVNGEGAEAAATGIRAESGLGVVFIYAIQAIAQARSTNALNEATVFSHRRAIRRKRLSLLKKHSTR